MMLQNGKTADAVEIFRLNVEGYPKSSNVYDSLGEAYAALGKRAADGGHDRAGEGAEGRRRCVVYAIQGKFLGPVA